MPAIINDVAKVYSDDQKKLLMSGRFISKDDTSIHLALLQNDILEVGQTVVVMLTSESHGLLPFRCRITEDSMLPQRFAVQQYIGVNFEIEEELPSIQRRRDIKVNLFMDAEITMLDLITGKPTAEIHRGYIKDISASGLLFVTKDELIVNQRFLIPLPKVGSQMMPQAKILRTQQEPDGKTGYGCCFLDLRPGQEEMLRQYVFKAQVMQRRKGGRE